MKGQDPSDECVDIFIKYGLLPGVTLYISKDPLNNVYKDVLEETAPVSESNSIVAKTLEGDSLVVNYPESNSSTSFSTDVDETNAADEDIEVEEEGESHARAYLKRNISSKFARLKSPYDYGAFLKNPLYIPSEFKSRLGVQVLIYSKTKFELYDITNFITSVNTSVSKESGGNFDINFQLISEDDLLKERDSHFQYNNINRTGYIKALTLQSVFRSNDIVYIRFENLKTEEENNEKKILGKYWDMIGLIDSTKIESRFDGKLS